MKPLVRSITAVGMGVLWASAAMAAPTPAPTPAPRPGKVSLDASLDTKDCDFKESTAGNMVADAVRQASGADVAFIPAGELVAATAVDQGSHTPDDIDGLLRYRHDADDTIVLLNITGKQLLAALDRSVSREPEAFDGFLQVSGMQVRFDASKPIGQRIVEAGVPGEPISEAKHYTVATTRAAANGSFGYFRVWGKSAVVNDSGITIVKALDDYVAAHPILSPMIDGRIVGL
jgi:5'-nucleotidase/UDP-sugar diphosphatase